MSENVNVVGAFEFVSFDEFSRAMKEQFDLECEGEQLETGLKKAYVETSEPERSTSGSAGYDFHSPIRFSIAPGESVVVPTAIKVSVAPGWFLMCLPRSSMGFKYHVSLCNTVGVIDSDYYNNPQNEGHIMLKLYNGGAESVFIERGDKIAQAIFVPYGVTENDDADKERVGGIGSTGV